MFTRVPIHQGSILALVYPWSTNTEHNGMKDKINTFVYTRTLVIDIHNGCSNDIKKNYINVSQQVEIYTYCSMNSMSKGRQKGENAYLMRESKAATYQGSRYVYPGQITTVKEVENGFLWLSCDIPRDTQLTRPFFKGDNYLLFPYILD